MKNVATIVIGIFIIVLGCLLAFRQMIWLLHSYHYKRVAEEDKPALCKWTGCGTILTGIGVILLPLLSELMGAVFVAAGVVISLAAIIKYNHGLF